MDIIYAYSCRVFYWTSLSFSSSCLSYSNHISTWSYWNYFCRSPVAEHAPLKPRSTQLQSLNAQRNATWISLLSDPPGTEPDQLQLLVISYVGHSIIIISIIIIIIIITGMAW